VSPSSAWRHDRRARPMNPDRLPESLLSRIEDAGLNASAPPQQRWVDGWLLRFSPGKAKRARCIQPVADGRLPLAERLALCQAVFEAAGLPAVVRLTPFSRPLGLDDRLAALGWHRQDDTRVMVAPQCPALDQPLPPGLVLQQLDAHAYAEVVGALRGSPPAQRLAHAQRLALSPVPYQGWALRQSAPGPADSLEHGPVLVCGQSAAEADLVGLYDVFTHPQARGRGLARLLCSRLLAQAHAAGARVAYLQVEADNHPARAVYHGLGFADAYAYHYRSPVADAG
jgi:ribosomal protein S18 acetylase RimI-like enzyme